MPVLPCLGHCLALALPTILAIATFAIIAQKKIQDEERSSKILEKIKESNITESKKDEKAKEVAELATS